MYKYKFLAVFAFISTLGFSQIFNFGLSGGGVFSQIDGDDLQGFNKLGLFLGYDLDITFNKNNPWGATFGMQYNNRGSRIRLDPDNPLPPTTTSWDRMSLHYFDVLLGTRYKTDQSFVFSAGLFSGLLISQRWTDLNGGLIDNPNFFKRSDLGSFLQIGYAFKPNLIASIDYKYSVLRINKSNSTFPGQFVPTSGMRNNFVQVGISYYFKNLIDK